jgi:methylated-DNA-[protein]-cysteine S-methyltransferase
MSGPGFAIVPTVLGAFGVVWAEAGVVRTWLHERTADAARRQMLRAFPGARDAAPPESIADAMADVVAMLNGSARMPSTALDMRTIPTFEQRVYEVARTIPYGRTMTYGEIAKALGEEPMRARDVGVALSRNPFAPIVPCHRVVAANGQLGGYSAPGGTSTKRRLLELEGAAIVAVPVQSRLFD